MKYQTWLNTAALFVGASLLISLQAQAVTDYKCEMLFGQVLPIKLITMKDGTQLSCDDSSSDRKKKCRNHKFSEYEKSHFQMANVYNSDMTEEKVPSDNGDEIIRPVRNRVFNNTPEGSTKILRTRYINYIGGQLESDFLKVSLDCKNKEEGKCTILLNDSGKNVKNRVLKHFDQRPHMKDSVMHADISNGFDDNRIVARVFVNDGDKLVASASAEMSLDGTPDKFEINVGADELIFIQRGIEHRSEAAEFKILCEKE